GPVASSRHSPVAAPKRTSEGSAIWLAQDFAQATQRAHIGAVPEVTQDRADQDGDDRDNEAAAQLLDMLDDAHRAVGGALIGTAKSPAAGPLGCACCLRSITHAGKRKRAGRRARIL